MVVRILSNDLYKRLDEHSDKRVGNRCYVESGASHSIKFVYHTSASTLDGYLDQLTLMILNFVGSKSYFVSLHVVDSNLEIHVVW